MTIWDRDYITYYQDNFDIFLAPSLPPCTVLVIIIATRGRGQFSGLVALWCFHKFLSHKIHEWIISTPSKNFIKGTFISETFDNYDRLNHHWPKIPANLNSFLERFSRWNFRLVVVQVIKIVKGYWDKATFTNIINWVEDGII